MSCFSKTCGYTGVLLASLASMSTVVHGEFFCMPVNGPDDTRPSQRIASDNCERDSHHLNRVANEHRQTLDHDEKKWPGDTFTCHHRHIALIRNQAPVIPAPGVAVSYVMTSLCPQPETPNRGMTHR